jgi:glyoxylase I family protein
MSKETLKSNPPAAPSGKGDMNALPLRLHHNAYVVADQERTRHFYEDIIGLPLRATWIEESVYDGDEFTFCHTFYGMADGGALAFFNFADPKIQKKYQTNGMGSVFNHIAFKVGEQTHTEIKGRCQGANVSFYEFDHGYCKSLYVTDPDGLVVEFTVDPHNVEEIAAHQEKIAHEALAAWQRGEGRPNNSHRPPE